ncbi:MAG: response regulator [Polyangiaceae bacterium]
MVGDLIATRPAYGEWDRSRTEAILTFVVATRRSQGEIESLIFDEGAFCRFPAAPPPASAATLRAKEVQSSEQPVPDVAPAARRRRFLIVEDDATCQVLLQELLKNYGECDSAANGEEAVARITESLAEGRHYQVVCLDIMMPGMDGHAVLTELRRLENDHRVARSSRSKVLMTTALSGYEHFHRSFVEECDSYLVKPITKRILDSTIDPLGASERVTLSGV